MKNFIRYTTLAFVLSLTFGATSSSFAQSGQKDCVTLENSKGDPTGVACVITAGKEYHVGPVGNWDGVRILKYTGCEAREKGQFECWAPGIATGRLFVHRTNGAFFAAIAPQKK